MADAVGNHQEFHVQYMMRKVERLQQLRADGKERVEVNIDELELLIVENVGLHLHMRRLEDAVGHALNFTSLLTMAKNDPEKVKNPNGE